MATPIRSAGYSGTPLSQKLGIKPHTKVLLLHAPAGYFEWLGSNLSGQLVSSREIPDLIHLFAANMDVMYKEMENLQQYVAANSRIIIWVSWYKKRAGIKTDLTENDIRNYALQHGLVDVKVCAVSETWSALKLVVPLAKR